MEWQGLEPWQAILVGAILAPITMALVNRVALGYWNFLRAPRNVLYYDWSMVLLLGWLVVFFTPLFLAPSSCKEPDPWGTWKYVHYAIVLAAYLIMTIAIIRTERHVDWCAHCRQR